jgi:hypothetical protein
MELGEHHLAPIGGERWRAAEYVWYQAPDHGQPLPPSRVTKQFAELRSEVDDPECQLWSGSDAVPVTPPVPMEPVLPEAPLDPSGSPLPPLPPLPPAPPVPELLK